MELRPITPADIEAGVEVFYAADEEALRQSHPARHAAQPGVTFCASHVVIDHSRYLPATFALP